MKLQWTEPAVSDLEAIRDFIRRDSEQYASQFVERVLDLVDREVIPRRAGPPWTHLENRAPCSS